MSQINDEKKSKIVISNILYTQLLEEILKNDINLNVIIDLEKDSGMVYKNDFEKYIELKMKDIIEKTMEKLNHHLNIFSEEQKKNCDKNDTFEEIVKYSRRMINKKFCDYQKEVYIQESIKNMFCSIFQNKKKESIIFAEKVMNNENNILPGY